jgi:hypothetical protein
MERDELARENHLFLVAQMPKCLLGTRFSNALIDAYGCMVDLLMEEREPGPDDFGQCPFDSGYIRITAPAAGIIIDENIDLFEIQSALCFAFKPEADMGELNDHVTVSVKGHDFTFTIDHYETDDPERGWIDCTNDPFSVPSNQEMQRRVVIDLAPEET